MKELFAATLILALLLGCSALAVTVFADRALFVSPPDAVAEGFVREVVTRRWDRARAYLASPDSMPRTKLEALRSRLGSADNVDARIITRNDSRAIVEVRAGSRVLRVGVVWEGGWRVEEVYATPVYGGIAGWVALKL